MPTKTTKLGETIKNFLNSQNMTVRTFTDKLCVALNSPNALTERSVTKWKNGESYPTIEKLIVISNVTGISIDELLKEEIKNFSEKFPPKKTDDLSEAAQETLFHLCKDKSVLRRGYVSAYYRLRCDEDGVSSEIHRFFTFQEAEQKYKEYYKEKVVKRRTDNLIKVLKDKNSDPATCISAYTRYTDVSVASVKDDEEEPLSTENTYYYTCISDLLGYSCTFDNGLDITEIKSDTIPDFLRCSSDDKKESHAIFDDVYNQVDHGIKNDFKELIDKGFLEVPENNIEVVEFTDQYRDENDSWQRNEFAIMDFCKVTFVPTLTSEEIADFLCDYYRKTLKSEKE